MAYHIARAASPATKYRVIAELAVTRSSFNSNPLSLLGEMLGSAIKNVFCHHKKLMYPPLWQGDYVFNRCMGCGKKQLYDPYSASGYGKFSHDIDRLIAEAPVTRFRREIFSPSPPRASRWARDFTLLVFRNGHRSEIKEHAIVGDTLLVFSQQKTARIAISDLDLAATQAANAQRGIQFRLPPTSVATLQTRRPA